MNDFEELNFIDPEELRPMSGNAGCKYCIDDFPDYEPGELDFND